MKNYFISEELHNLDVVSYQACDYMIGIFLRQPKISDKNVFRPLAETKTSAGCSIFVSRHLTLRGLAELKQKVFTKIK